MSTFEEHIEKRIDKIEQILDRLTNTIIALAKAEEKLSQLESSKTDIMNKISLIEGNITKISDCVSNTSAKVTLLNRIIIGTFTGIIISAFAFILTTTN
jgi:peptidoglycan hydrolase CwlO-like protein